MDDHINVTKSALKHIDNKSGLATSPLNTLSKVLKDPMMNDSENKSSTKHATTSKAMKQADEKNTSNNNKSNVIGGEDDSDDDVFLDDTNAKKSTEKSLKHEEEDDKVETQATASCDVTPSVKQQNITASTTMPPSKTHNANSRELTAAGETAVR